MPVKNEIKATASQSTVASVDNNRIAAASRVSFIACSLQHQETCAEYENMHVCAFQLQAFMSMARCINKILGAHPNSFRLHP